jgi:hypothetical protein
MSFELHLTLSGLCALVPSDAIPQVPDHLRFLHVLLPDVRQPSAIDGNAICAHDPVLTIDQPGGSTTSVDLRGDDIAIRGVDGQAGVDLDQTFVDVAEMVRVKNTFTVDAALFQTPIGRNVIVARLRLAAASGSAFDVSATTLGFATQPLYTRNFAHKVLLTIPIAGDQGSFVITPLTGGAARAEVSFAPAQLGQPVRATLSNLCDEAQVVHDIDSDFAAFYKLEPKLVGPFPVPLQLPALQALLDSTAPARRPGEVIAQATKNGTCIPAVTSPGGI